ncbi:hypothetical protein ACIP69_11780 [Streptomyces hygroscopicus]|uniref:hypothetical protein n=1 Tax=Streptomyces hygroscopicus TaxID=1912 RepID=UPI0038278D54
MNIGKKAILLTAAAGSLVIGGAGGALAHANNDFIAQLNHCDTSTGAISQLGGAAPTGNIEVGADCVNFTNVTTGSVIQANDCDTATGPILQTGGASPTRDVNVGAKCTNIAVSDQP